VTQPIPAASTGPGLRRWLVLLFSVTGAIAVGNLYWAQPLLAVIAGHLGVSPGTAGLLVTVTQIGYAIGILFVVPLGDALNRRLLIPAVMVLSALALAAAAVAPGFAPLLAALACVGLTTTTGQMLLPFASDLSRPEDRGRVIGTITSGILCGILLSRSVSGVLADIGGWRSVFATAAGLSLVTAALIWRLAPADPGRSAMSYGQLLRSMPAMLRARAELRAGLLLGACTFAVFSLFWTGLTFLLSGAPYDYSLSRIGLVGIAGLAGALAARNAGRLHDRGLSVPVQGVALLLTLAAFAAAGFWGQSLAVILACVVGLDATLQTCNVLNQVRLMNIIPEARSRVNSLIVTANFIGGAVGSALAGALWGPAGWAGLMAAACVITLTGFGIWAGWRRRFAAISPGRV